MTTRYDARISIVKFAELAAKDADPEFRRGFVEGMTENLGSDTVATSVWLDDDGLIRRERLDLTLEIEGELLEGSLLMTFSDFSDGHEVAVPDDGDVKDVSDEWDRYRVHFMGQRVLPASRPVNAAAAPVWGDPAAWENPPPLAGDVHADVCVVGLGGSGLAAVGAALDAGATVAGIDAGPVAGGAAGRNGGFLLAGGALFHHAAVDAWGEERAVGIYAESLAELDRLEAELGPLVRRVGSLRIPASDEEEADCAAQLAALRRHGFPAEPADGPTGAGVFIPTDGSVQPLERCRLLARRALQRGARLFCGTPALELAGDRVRTPAGAISCGAVVVCVDGGLESLLPELAGQARSSRLQMLATEPIAPGTIPCPVYDNWGYDYWQQLPDGSVTLGGGRGSYGDSEWGRPAEPGPEVQDLLDRLLRERVGVDAAVTHRWAGVIAYTLDRLPVFAQVRPGVIAVGAHSGHGNVLGSAAGRAAMAIALGEPPPRIAQLLRPEIWS